MLYLITNTENVRRNGSSYDALADVIVDDNDAVGGDGGGVAGGAVVAGGIAHKNSDGSDAVERKLTGIRQLTKLCKFRVRREKMKK